MGYGSRENRCFEIAPLLSGVLSQACRERILHRRPTGKSSDSRHARCVMTKPSEYTFYGTYGRRRCQVRQSIGDARTHIG